MDDKLAPSASLLEEWKEPRIDELNVEDTHYIKNGRGHEPSRYPDCTRS